MRAGMEPALGMNPFALVLCDGTHTERIERVVSFVGEDPSGSFGVLAGHERLMTWLTLGLARFRTDEGPWQYLAVPGAVLYFADNELSISTRRYVIDADYQRIRATLESSCWPKNEICARSRRRCAGWNRGCFGGCGNSRARAASRR